MTEHEGSDGHDLRDVMDNPEWSEDDIRARRSLSDFAPELAKNIARVLGRASDSDAHADVGLSTGRKTKRPA